MGDARTGRPFCRRYALCSCKSISTEISARTNTTAQKNIAAPRTALTQRLTHSTRKSRSATSPLQSYLHGDRGFDRRMWIVPDELEIFEFEVVNVFDREIQFHSRQWPEFAGELLMRLVEVVFVKMQIAKCVNKITRHQIDDLRHH